jgi:hypothetical protein
MATQSSIRKPKDTLEKPIPDSSIPYIDFKTLAKQNARNSLQSKGNQNLYIQEEQTTQWSKEKVQKDKHIKLNIE